MNARQSTGWKGLGLGVIILLSSLLSDTAAQPCVQPPPGVVGWWPGDGAATDIAGSANGTLQDGATFAAGLISHAFRFDGVGAAVETLPTNIMNILPLTIEAWVQPALREDETSFAPSNALSNDNPGIGGHGFGVNVYASDSRLDVQFQGGHGREQNFRRVPGVSLIDGQWYHVAVVYTPGNFKAYVDGRLVDDFSFTQAALGGVNFVRIGKHNDDVGYGTVRFFKGLIDEVTIYHHALSTEQIQAIVNAASAGKCKAPFGFSCQGGRSHIRGQVTTVDEEIRLPNVTLTLIGPEGCREIATTQGFGVYLFPRLQDGTYTVTPSKLVCTFDPPTWMVTIEGGYARLNFEASCL